MLLKWTNVFPKDKNRDSHKKVTWKCRPNSKNTHAKVWPWQFCIANLLESHCGTEATLKTSCLPLVRRPMEGCFWKENRIYENIYIHNTNMTKYCAINLNARYKLNFKHSRNETSNVHIFVDLPSIQGRNFTWKVDWDVINFERWIHLENMKSVWRGTLDVDFQSRRNIDKFSAWIVQCRFDAESLFYWLFPFYHFRTFYDVWTYSKLIWYTAQLM